MPCFILSIDQEKAFDKVDRAFLLQILEKYNLGEHFISFINTLYVDASASILNGGFLSDFFLTERGVREVDQLLLLLYVFVAEVLALLVRGEDGIEGISLPDTPKPLKIQQYDGNSVLFTNSGKSVESFFKKVDIFQKASGSVINALKARGLALGGFDPTTDPRLTDVTWANNTGIKILGVTFYTRLNQTTNFNWLRTLNKTDKKLNISGLRLVSLRGKAMLLNTLVLSKL